MARSLLARLLKNKKTGLLTDISHYQDRVSIQDVDGSWLLGSESQLTPKYPIQTGDQIYGWVLGDDAAPLVALLLANLVGKELENESLTDETLALYREINLVYNLSENLADTLDLHTVARLVLGEARRLIPNSCGVVLFLDSALNTLQVMDEFGATLDWVTLFTPIAHTGKADIVIDAQADSRFSLADQPIHSFLYAPLKTKHALHGVLILANVNASHYTANDLKLLTTLGTLAAAAMENALLHERTVQEEKIRANLLRQFSPKVAESLVKNPKPFELGGNHVFPITLLMSDIRGFTAKSASMESHEVVRLLNEMFSRLVPIIFKYDGTIDKFIGDAILAVFGSPESDTEQWEKAVSAALEMQQAMQNMQSTWQIGIGIHTGEAVHGFIGSIERMEYTVIGDTVNRTSRYCDGAQGGEILISREVYPHVNDIFEFAPTPRRIQTKHSATEGALEGYIVTARRS